MPLSHDAKGGGTDANGDRSSDFCSYCYKDGRFTHPRLTLEQMIARAQGKLRQMGIPELIVRRAPAHISKLARWKAPHSGRKRAR
ncbi:MAG: zinc ribbon domain-containing protein [Anaerolineae bacterium]|nr:zinc ribbon domain-containing protein [Gemmatimonadaceae bacterium]